MRSMYKIDRSGGEGGGSRNRSPGNYSHELEVPNIKGMGRDTTTVRLEISNDLNRILNEFMSRSPHFGVNHYVLFSISFS